MQKIKVENKDDNKKLITFLTSKYPSLSINAIYKVLRKKDIKINGKRINSNVNVHQDDEIEIYLDGSTLNGFDKNINIPIAYEDDNIVVFNKPKNLEVEGKNSLTEILEKSYNFIKPCHRIDRNTIGLVLFALDIIHKAFIDEEIEKTYIACCYGIPKKDATLNAYLFKDRKKSIVYISKEPKKGASKIQTSYTLIDQNKEKNLSLLKVNISNGKTHQIRAHLAFAGLPILGDGKYGSYEINKKFNINNNSLPENIISMYEKHKKMNKNFKFFNDYMKKSTELKDIFNEANFYRNISLI